MTNHTEILEKKKTSKQVLRAQVKDEKLRAKMRKQTIETFKGKTNLRELVETVGVRTRVEYWNDIEITTKSVNATFRIERHIHDYGLIFNDGFEIRHVDKTFFNYFDCPIICKRERK